MTFGCNRSSIRHCAYLLRALSRRRCLSRYRRRHFRVEHNTALPAPVSPPPRVEDTMSFPDPARISTRGLPGTSRIAQPVQHVRYGESLAAGFPSGPAAVTARYVEGVTFVFLAYNEHNHFTQLVWRDPTKMGCAYKDCSAKSWQLYVVSEWDPVDYAIGQEHENSLPPVSL